jgi:Skp family chaperone for outer membrane proteins
VKKTLACVAGAIVLASGFGVWTALAPAQAPGQPPQRGGVIPASTNPAAATNPPAATQPQVTQTNNLPGTRVAVVNINKVLKDYQKAQKLNNDIKTEVQQFAQRMEAKKAELTKLQAQLTQPGTLQAQREQIERTILAINRDLQDIDNEARKVISKKQGDIAVMIFREIESVIKSVATSQGYDIVFSYPDGTTPEEMYSQDNIVRKLAAQAAMPLFYKPQNDVTQHVIVTLNHYFQPTGAAPGAQPPVQR